MHTFTSNMPTFKSSMPPAATDWGCSRHRPLPTDRAHHPRWMQRQRREGLHWWTAGPSMSNSTRWCVSVPQESPGRRRVRP